MQGQFGAGAVQGAHHHKLKRIVCRSRPAQHLAPGAVIGIGHAHGGIEHPVHRQPLADVVDGNDIIFPGKGVQVG